MTDQETRFTVMAAHSALEFWKASPAPEHPDEYTYLPKSVAQAQTFKPHGWVLDAMRKAYQDGRDSLRVESEQRMQELRNSHVQQIAALERQLQKYKLLDAIREEATSFSVNTKDLLDMVYDLALLVP